MKFEHFQWKFAAWMCRYIQAANDNNIDRPAFWITTNLERALKAVSEYEGK